MSIPHISLFLTVDKNELKGGFINFILKLAFLIVISVDESKALERESKEINAKSSRSITFNFITDSSSITIGLTLRLCCAIGVIIIFPD